MTTTTITTDRKARIAAVIAGLGALAAGGTDDGIAVGEVIAAAAAAAVAYGAVFGISNSKAVELELELDDDDPTNPVTPGA